VKCVSGRRMAKGRAGNPDPEPMSMILRAEGLRNEAKAIESER